MVKGQTSEFPERALRYVLFVAAYCGRLPRRTEEQMFWSHPARLGYKPVRWTHAWLMICSMPLVTTQGREDWADAVWI